MNNFEQHGSVVHHEDGGTEVGGSGAVRKTKEPVGESLLPAESDRVHPRPAVDVPRPAEESEALPGRELLAPLHQTRQRPRRRWKRAPLSNAVSISHHAGNRPLTEAHHTAEAYTRACRILNGADGERKG